MNLLRLIIIACVYMSISIFGALDSYATIINFNGKLDYIHFEEDASGQDIYPAGGRILAASSCSGIAGEWAGNWSETSCDTFDYSGSWTGTVSSDCVFTGTDNWDHVSGTIDPITLNVTASGISEDGCGAINVSGTFVGNSVSGSYSYSAGGGGLYSGTKIVGTISDNIIGAWSNGIWYLDVAASNWTRMSRSAPDGDIAAGDFTGDGKADVASIWSSGLWYQNGATLGWTKIGTAPNSVTTGDVTGDSRFEIIGTWSSGIWYYNVVTSNWTRMSRSAPDGDIAAGDFTGDGRADVASTWSSGLWYQNGATLIWTKVSDLAPNSVTAGNITGN